MIHINSTSGKHVNDFTPSPIINWVWLCLGLSVALTACATPSFTPIKTMQELHYETSNEQHLIVDNFKICVTDDGEGPETLLLVHPWAGNIGFWDDITPLLSQHFRVVRVDLPGHGKSSKPETRYNIELGRDTIIAVMDQLNLTQVTLVGNSMGGAVSLLTTRDYPDRVKNLILIDALGSGLVPSVFAFGTQNWFVAPLFANSQPWMIDFSTRFVIEDNDDAHDALVSEILANIDSADGYAWSLAVTSYLRNIVNFDATPWLKDITASTLIIWGRDDWVLWPVSAEHFHERLPNSQLAWIEGCGHMPQVEQPETVFMLIYDFLNNQPPSTKPTLGLNLE